MCVCMYECLGLYGCVYEWLGLYLCVGVLRCLCVYECLSVYMCVLVFGVHVCMSI